MKHRPLVAVLNSIEAGGAQVLSSNGEWSIVKTSAGKEILLGAYPLGKIVRVDTYDPYAEVNQLVIVGADVTPEVIAAATRYKIEVGNPDDKYESYRSFPVAHAYTSPAVLSGNAYTDRTNVYTALVNKANSYANNNVTAYGITVADYTLGGSVGDAAAGFIIGENVEQETSGETAKVAKYTITSGTFATDNAAGKIWLYDISDHAAWLTTAKKLTADGTVAATTLLRGSTNLIITVTNATTYHYQGIALVDEAGYFTSSIARPGANWVGATQGWSTSVAEVAISSVYSMGIGSVMAQLVPRYDYSKQDAITGFLEYELVNNDSFDITKTYKKYVITMADGDENALSADREAALKEVTLYADFGDGDLGDLTTAIAALT